MGTIEKEFEQNRESTLEIYESAKPLVEFLIGQNETCDLFVGLGEKDFIAEGVQGSVWRLDVSNLPKGKYVVKLRSIDVFMTNAKASIIVSDLIKKYPYNEYPYLNQKLNGWRNRIIKAGNPIYYITKESITPCLTKDSQTFARTDGNGETIVPKGSYLCLDDTYSEYLVSLIASNFFEKGMSANFISGLSFFTCIKTEERPKLASYTVMQKIDGDIEKLLSDLKEDELLALYVQIVHAICVYQTQFIIHGDLHTGNVFYENIKPTTTFNGKSVDSANYFEYRVGGTSLFIPNTGKLIKIGDWGMASKYTPPMIFNYNVVENGMDQDDEQGPWLPNWFAPNYDLLVVTYYMFFHTRSIIMRKALTTCLGIIDPDEKEKTVSQAVVSEIAKYINIGYNKRPYIDRLSTIAVTPQMLLNMPFIKNKFGEAPIGKRVVLLGVA